MVSLRYYKLETSGQRANTQNAQPPKRKLAGTAAPRRSKLAKEHNVSAQEENEIHEAFSLFSEAMDGEKHGVLPTGDVKSAMMCVHVPSWDEVLRCANG